MKKLLPALFIIVVMFASAFAQTIGKPTLIPAEPTAAQKQLIDAGARLHDEGRYDEAIANYDKVLQQNPTCVMAIYEKTLSLYYKKDFKQTLALAYEGIKYKSNEIPLFYGLIANVYDDQGNPQKAIELYKQGIGLLEGDAEFNTYLANLYYNLGVTNFGLKKFGEARENLKKAVSLHNNYASPHYLLANLYRGTGYKIPALLAAARLISLEANSNRTKNSATIFREVIGGNATQSADGKTTINLDPNAPKDEGDFTSFDLTLSVLAAVKPDTVENKSDLDNLANAVEKVVALLAEDKSLASTFVGKNYIPFMIEMKTRGYVKPFACLVLIQEENPSAELWLDQNKPKVSEFLVWARSYKPV